MTIKHRTTRWYATPRPPLRQIAGASVTPMASIFGSGFLIIVPVLERAIGGLALVGTAAICLLAILVGTAIRHNVAHVEPLVERGELRRSEQWLEKASDLVIVVAYIISVALYLRIMAQYIVGYLDGRSTFAERALTVAVIIFIVLVGITRGFHGLHLLERISLGTALGLVAALGGTYLAEDVGGIAQATLDIPPVPHTSLGQALLVLGGVVITVQGFETVRYLQAEYDIPTRIWACRLSQAVSTVVYLAFVAVATPLTGVAAGVGPDIDLLDLTRRVAPLLLLPLVLCATLSQFSAAIADTVAADGNLRSLWSRMGHRTPYLITGVSATALAVLATTYTIIVIASRAFAAYYCLQCVVAVRTSDGLVRRVGFGALAVVLLAVTSLAQPA